MIKSYFYNVYMLKMKNIHTAENLEYMTKHEKFCIFLEV